MANDPDFILNISLDLPDLPTGRPVFPTLQWAVQRIAQAAHTRWLNYATGRPLPGGQTIGGRSGAYAQSILLRQLDPLNWQVYSDAPYAAAIEFGSAPLDMKKALLTSAKVRRVQAKGKHHGQRYLIIPFRHGSPGAATFGGNVMNDDQHALARDLLPSHITGATRRPSGNFPGETVHQNTYKWGGRLPAGLAPKLRPAHATDPLAGMVKFQSNRGGNRDTGYLTFRVMGEWSPGWLRPAQPGKFPARTALEDFKDLAQTAFSAALNRDLQAIIGGGA